MKTKSVQKCSTSQSFTFPKFTSFKIGTLVFFEILSNNIKKITKQPKQGNSTTNLSNFGSHRISNNLALENHFLLFSWIHITENSIKIYLRSEINLALLCENSYLQLNPEKFELEPSCRKKRQKSPNQETGLGNRGCLKVLIVTKLILND